MENNLQLEKIKNAIRYATPPYDDGKIILLSKKWWDNYAGHPILNYDSWFSVICEEEEFIKDWTMPTFEIATISKGCNN